MVSWVERLAAAGRLDRAERELRDAQTAVLARAPGARERLARARADLEDAVYLADVVLEAVHLAGRIALGTASLAGPLYLN